MENFSSFGFSVLLHSQAFGSRVVVSAEFMVEVSCLVAVVVDTEESVDIVWSMVTVVSLSQVHCSTLVVVLSMVLHRLEVVVEDGMEDSSIKVLVLQSWVLVRSVGEIVVVSVELFESVSFLVLFV